MLLCFGLCVLGRRALGTAAHHMSRLFSNLHYNKLTFYKALSADLEFTYVGQTNRPVVMHTHTLFLSSFAFRLCSAFDLMSRLKVFNLFSPSQQSGVFPLWTSCIIQGRFPHLLSARRVDLRRYGAAQEGCGAWNPNVSQITPGETRVVVNTT